VAYRRSAIGLKAIADPRAARVEIVAAFEAAGCDARAAAKRLGVTRRTFDRLVAALSLDERVLRLRRAARKRAA
jgi:transposase